MTGRAGRTGAVPALVSGVSLRSADVDVRRWREAVR
jgi:hypothetical protein